MDPYCIYVVKVTTLTVETFKKKFIFCIIGIGTEKNLIFESIVNVVF
jgi:hypothetical protein